MKTRLILSALIVIALALVINSIGEAKPPNLRRLTRWECKLEGPGSVQRCKSQGLDVEIALTDITDQSVLLTKAEFRNSGPLLCASLDKVILWGGLATVTMIGPVDFQEGRKEDYGFGIDFPGLEPNQVLQETIAIIFLPGSEDC